jgi:hypothetical protein
MSENASLKLIAVTLVSLAGCAVPVFLSGGGGSSHSVTLPAPGTPDGVKELPAPKAKIHGSTYKINPQSFTYHGGKLEDYDYFYSNTTDPAQAQVPFDGSSAPASVIGHLATGGTEILQLVGVADDRCVASGGPAALDGPSPLGTLPLYRVEKFDPATGTTIDLCNGEAYAFSAEETCSPADLQTLSGKAIAAPGYWNPTTGTYQQTLDGTTTGKQVFSLSCMTGAVAKCMHWGYVPYKSFQGTQLSPYFQACVRAARAQYTATSSTSYTCEGTEVDFYDRLGIQTISPAGNLSFEAAWKQGGPLCVGKPRYDACSLSSAVTSILCTERDWTNVANWPADVLLATRSSPSATPGECPVNGANCPQ